MNIRIGTPDDLDQLRILFEGTIKHICTKDYSAEQISVWSNTSANHERWEKIISEQLVLVAHDSHLVTGFITLAGSHIDMLYVHKNYQRLGTAKHLYERMEHHAIRKGYQFLTSDVSKTAKPFFINMGFSVVAEQTVFLKGTPFINFKMRKVLY